MIHAFVSIVWYDFYKKIDQGDHFFFYENHPKQIYHLGRAIDLDLLYTYILISFLYTVWRRNLVNVRLSLLVEYAPRRKDNDESVEEQHEIFAEILVVERKVVMERMEIFMQNEERCMRKSIVSVLL